MAALPATAAGLGLQMPAMYPTAIPGYLPGYGMYPSPTAAMNPYLLNNPLQNVVYGYNPYDLEVA